MSIYYNNKVIAGSSTPSSYRFVGEIFQSVLPINDTKVHLLDGSLIYSDDGYREFIQFLSSLQLLYPQLFCTEEVWQEKVAQYNEWGQFVLTSESVRLPKITSFIQGLSSLSDLATLVEAGLPNITGDFKSEYTISFDNGSDATGAFKTPYSTTSGKYGNSTADSGWGYGLNFNASLSNPIYGNSDTVQPQAIRYPYYIVLATGVTQNIQSVQDITFNTPFFLGMYQYFDKELDNISWLKSTGQWHDKDLYTDYYNWILKQINTTYTKISAYAWTCLPGYEVDGVEGRTYYTGTDILKVDDTLFINSTLTANSSSDGKVTAINTDGTINGISGGSSGRGEIVLQRDTSKDIISVARAEGFKTSDEDYTDYDFVLNTENNTFRLPIVKGERVLVAKKVATDDDKSWYNLYSDGWLEQGGYNNGLTQNSTITLLKPFANTNYTILTGRYFLTTADDPASISYQARNITTTSFQVRQTFATSNGGGLDTGNSYAYKWYVSGYTLIPQPSDYTENIGLYFYVGETVQNGSLINAGKMSKSISNVIPSNSSLITSYAMPDYNSGIDITSSLSSKNVSWVAPCDGMIFATINANDIVYLYTQSGCTSITYTYTDKAVIRLNGESNEYIGATSLIYKGLTLYTSSDYANSGKIYFYPLKGAN